MNNKLKIGILGCANIAARYMIKAFQSTSAIESISIADRDYSKAKEWASRFSIKAGESYEFLLNSDIDAVYVPLPIGIHKEWTIKAAKKNKHIFCEKSLAENFDAVKEMVNFCQSKGLVLYEDFMCDFHPQHAKALSLIESGNIGKPFIFDGHFGFPPLDRNSFRYDKKLGGSSLSETGAYIVFMARKIFNKEPLSVTCNLFYDKEKEVDIKGSAILEFPDEMIAHIAFSFDAVYQNNYSVWGSKGLIRASRAYSIPPEMKPILELITNENSQELVANIDVPATNHFELIVNDFCDTILNKEKRADKINHIYSRLLSQARALEAMRLSAKENRKVKITEIK